MKNIIKKLLRENLLNEFFNKTISNQIKKLSHRYEGRNVIWYGDPTQMISIKAEYVDGMFGNVYDNKKLEFVTNMIQNSEEKVEFECSYAFGNVINFLDIQEQQQDRYSGNFEINFDGHDRPVSTGDNELDDYVGIEELRYADFVGHYVDDERIIYFMDEYRFSLVEEKETKDSLANKIQKFQASASEDEQDVLNEFYEYEVKLKFASDNNLGDFNQFRVQLRDGHHRVFGAIAAGEEYICVNLAKDYLERYKGYYEKV